MKRPKDKDSVLRRVASQLIKYLLLSLVFLAIACLVSPIFGVLHIFMGMLPAILYLLWRLGLILFCLLAMIIVTESMQ